MIYQHEIPKGARLYFGKSAKLKRDIEMVASSVLYEKGFEEIVTPLFSYHQHTFIEDENELIRINDEKNRKLTIRADSTVDVVRLITKRLKSVEHSKWYYIQPVYRYPTKEFYQIGAEILESKDAALALKTVLAIFEKLSIKASLQISNIKIPELLSTKYGVVLEHLRHLDVDEILKSEEEWVQKLLYLSSVEQIDALLGLVPEDIEVELLKMKELALAIEYEDMIIAPLFYAKMRYYKDLFFRFFHKNETLAMGGDYVTKECEASGFAIYTDTLIDYLEEGDRWQLI